MSLNLLLLIAALVCFFLATINLPSRVSLVALGLFFFILSLLIGGYVLLELGKETDALAAAVAADALPPPTAG